MPPAAILASGHVEIHGPVEALVFLLCMIGLGGWMSAAGFRMRRRSPLETMFGLFLAVVGASLALLSLFLLIGGLLGVEGIRKISL